MLQSYDRNEKSFCAKFDSYLTGDTKALLLRIIFLFLGCGFCNSLTTKCDLLRIAGYLPDSSKLAFTSQKFPA